MKFNYAPYLICLLLIGGGLAEAQDKPRRQREIRYGSPQMRSLVNTAATLSGRATLRLTDDRPLVNSTIDITSPDAWVLFESLRPSVVQRDHLRSIAVDGKPAEHGVNARLVPYETGAVLIPHGPGYAALQAWDRSGYSGESLSFVVHKYYKADELGALNDKLASFKLKKGYMATLAENPDGTGASKVFIAHKADVNVARLPAELRGKVSFVRVFPWRWTAKKGFGGSEKAATQLNCAWRYQWGAGSASTLDVEFVPMRHNAGWPAWEKINNSKHVTHVLGFNEPMQKDQANMTVEQCLAQWPKLMASGLRVGSPSPTDGGLNWLYRFMDEADKRGYRVDFVAVHFYRGHYTADGLVDWLGKIHKRTGRPIWLTEFNNGADWVKNHNPSLQENAKKIDAFIEALDRAPFVERYAVFNLGNAKYHRQVIKNGKLTPAGIKYRDNESPQAYRGELRTTRRR